MDRRPGLQPAEIKPELASDAVVGFGCLLFPMCSFDELLGAEGDEYADHDDADFADEHAPAMHRLWQMEMHGAASGGYESVTDVPMSAMGRKQTFGGKGWRDGRRPPDLALRSLSAIGAAVRDDPAAARGATPKRDPVR